MTAKTVLVVAAHPDDEVLGCGGTIARHVRWGDEVYVRFMTDGVGARGDDKDAASRRIEAADAALSILDVSGYVPLAYPDNAMDTVPLLDVINSVEISLEEIEPNIVYTHHSGDLNVDHRITHQAVMTACRPQPGSQIEAIYGFEVCSSTEWGLEPFVPNNYVILAENDLKAKIEALKAYEEEMRPFPHARSMKAVKALARMRGCHVGVKRAEAFHVYRQVWR